MSRRIAAGLALAGTLTLGSCASKSAPATSPSVATDTARPTRDTHENLNGVLWMQQSAEYEVAVESAYARAGDLLAAGLARARTDPSWSAAPEQRGGDYSGLPPAVVMDLDETVFDNSPVQGRGVLEREGAFNRAEWSRWVGLARAAAVPGAIAFIQEARTQAAVVFVTNRTAEEEPATRANLAALGVVVDGSEILSLGESDESGQPWKGERADKTWRRAWLATRYRILLIVGDDLADFAPVGGKTPDERKRVAREFRAYWKDRWVMLPNPTYGSWERAIADPSKPDAERLALKRRSIRSF